MISSRSISDYILLYKTGDNSDSTKNRPFMMAPTRSSPSSLLLLAAVLIFQLLHDQVSACPKQCSCGKNEMTVMCQQGSITEIEPELKLSLERLILEKVSGLETIKGNFLLKHSQHLKLLKISQSSVETIEAHAFTNLLNLEELDLSENNLLSLDPTTFSGLSKLRSLNLVKNKLSRLEAPVLSPLGALRILNLTHNALQDISPSVFDNQTSLISLTLNSNPLKHLTSKSFSGLNALQELRLRDCSLQSIHMDLFYAVPKLSYLNLGQNRLSKPLSPAVITNLAFLNTLIFDHNELPRLDHEDFALLHLHFLDLSYNRINYIERTAFQNLTVKELDLSYNMILSLSTDFLNPLSSQLTNVNLAGNPLEKIDDEAFKDFQYLERLNLSSCSLDTLHHNTLSDLPVLKTLDISHNNLHFLSKELIGLINGLSVIHLHKNAWVCDCQITPLKEWTGKTDSWSKMQCPPSRRKHQECVALRCAFPAQLYQKTLTEVKKDELGECLSPEDSMDLPASTQGAIVAACLGFAIIFLIITIYLWRRGKTSFRLKRVCMPSNAESSHMIDEDSKVPPLSNCDRASLNESDHEFVVRHYFDTLVTDPKLMSRTSDSEEPTSPKERDSMYSSQPSLYSYPHAAPMGIESTV